jgi:hypothetical protein
MQESLNTQVLRSAKFILQSNTKSKLRIILIRYLIFRCSHMQDTCLLIQLELYEDLNSQDMYFS